MAPRCLSGSVPGSLAGEWVIKGHVSSPLVYGGQLCKQLPVFFFSPQSLIYICPYYVFRVLKSGTEKKTSRPKGSERAAIAREGKANIGKEHQPVSQDAATFSCLVQRWRKAPFPQRYTECSMGKWNLATTIQSWGQDRPPEEFSFKLKGFATS